MSSTRVDACLPACWTLSCKTACGDRWSDSYNILALSCCCVLDPCPVRVLLLQVAYPMAMLVRHKPRLVWLQWGLEQLASAAVLPLQLLLALVGDAASLLTDGTSALTIAQQQPLQLQQACMQDTWAQVARPPARAPDLETPAGRLVLALSMGLVLFVVLYVPLLFAWRLERHLKARYMLTAVQQHASVRSSRDSSHDSSSPTHPASSGPSSTSKAVRHPGTHSSSSSADFVSPGPSFPLFPTVKGALAWHLGAAAGVCFLLGELFVWACTVSPAVAGILWEQIPGQPT